MKKVCSLLLVFIILLTTSVSAGAAAKVKLSSDRTFLHIESADTLPEFDERFSSVTEIYFTDCVIDKNLLLWGSNEIEKMTFENCEFKVGRLRLPENVKEIIFEDTLFRGMSFANILSKLKKIKVYNCNFDNLEKFSSANNLEELVINYCSIGSLKGIEGLKSLTDLNLDYTKVEKISGVENLGNLDFLSMKNSSVRDVSGLKNLKLKYLNVDNCSDIDNLDVVTELPELEDLFADNCEMAVTEKLVSYLEKSDVSSNLNRESLKIKNQVRKIYKSIIKKNMTKEEIIGNVVAYVCNSISYDKKAEKDDRLYKQYNDNRLKFALSGKGVSENYTALTTALLKEGGIRCYEVESEESIWNLVESGGNYYWLDSAEIDKSGVKNIGDSDWFMKSGLSLPETHSVVSLPSSAYLNQEGFNGQYKQTKDFVLGKLPSVNLADEEETEEETSQEETTAGEETTISEETEKTTEEETTKYERPRWYTETFIDEDEGKTMGKIVVAVFSALAVFIGAFFIIRRYREKY